MLPRLVLLLLSLSSLYSATPLPDRESTSDVQQSTNSTTTPIVLGSDDIIVVGRDGNVTVMKTHEWDELVRRAEDLFGRQSDPGAEITPGAFDSRAIQQGQQLSERDCEESTEVQVLDTTYFNGEDVVMSSVVHATGQATGPGNNIAVTDGFQLANAITVGTSTSIVVIKDILTTSFSIQYAKTWTTTYTAAYTFVITKDSYGVVVSNPWTRKLTGYTYSGCTNNWVKETFSTNSFTDQSYDGLGWVQGVIRLCESTEYPIPYCEGSGSHY